MKPQVSTGFLALSILGTLGALACKQNVDAGVGLASETRDSAGIRIIENPRPDEGSRLAWQIGPEPTVSIGVLEGEEPYMLHWVADATKLPDGRIVVANGGSGDLRVFDEGGSHLVTWGGGGDGPGEFPSLAEVGAWPGDSIVAWFTGAYGMAVFDSNGHLGRSFVLQSRESVNWLRPRPHLVRQNGTILSIKERQALDSVDVEIWDGAGALSASTGAHPSDEIIFTTDDRDNTLVTSIAYGRQLVTGLWGGLVVVSPTSRYEIKAFREDGALARIVRRGHVPRAPTEADREPYVEDQMIHILETPNLPDFMVEEARRSFGSAPFAATFPAFSSVMGDVAGNLWVEEYEFPREDWPTRLWTVFDPEGRVLGFVETPDGLEIYEIGEDYILGHTRDDLDVEYVQVWRLEPVQAAGSVNGEGR